MLKTTGSLKMLIQITIKTNIDEGVGNDENKGLAPNLSKSQKLKNLINFFKFNRFYLRLW